MPIDLTPQQATELRTILGKYYNTREDDEAQAFKSTANATDPATLAQSLNTFVPRILQRADARDETSYNTMLQVNQALARYQRTPGTALGPYMNVEGGVAASVSPLERTDTPAEGIIQKIGRGMATAWGSRPSVHEEYTEERDGDRYGAEAQRIQAKLRSREQQFEQMRKQGYEPTPQQIRSLENIRRMAQEAAGVTEHLEGIPEKAGATVAKMYEQSAAPFVLAGVRGLANLPAKMGLTKARPGDYIPTELGEMGEWGEWMEEQRNKLSPAQEAIYEVPAQIVGFATFGKLMQPLHKLYKLVGRAIPAVGKAGKAILGMEANARKAEVAAEKLYTKLTEDATLTKMAKERLKNPTTFFGKMRGGIDNPTEAQINSMKRGLKWGMRRGLQEHREYYRLKIAFSRGIQTVPTGAAFTGAELMGHGQVGMAAPGAEMAALVNEFGLDRTDMPAYDLVRPLYDMTFDALQAIELPMGVALPAALHVGAGTAGRTGRVMRAMGGARAEEMGTAPPPEGEGAPAPEGRGGYTMTTKAGKRVAVDRPAIERTMRDVRPVGFDEASTRPQAGDRGGYPEGATLGEAITRMTPARPYIVVPQAGTTGVTRDVTAEARQKMAGPEVGRTGRPDVEPVTETRAPSTGEIELTDGTKIELADLSAPDVIAAYRRGIEERTAREGGVRSQTDAQLEEILNAYEAEFNRQKTALEMERPTGADALDPSMVEPGAILYLKRVVADPSTSASQRASAIRMLMRIQAGETAAKPKETKSKRRARDAAKPADEYEQEYADLKDQLTEGDYQQRVTDDLAKAREKLEKANKKEPQGQEAKDKKEAEIAELSKKIEFLESQLSGAEPARPAEPTEPTDTRTAAEKAMDEVEEAAAAKKKKKPPPKWSDEKKRRPIVWKEKEEVGEAPDVAALRSHLQRLSTDDAVEIREGGMLRGETVSREGGYKNLAKNALKTVTDEDLAMFINKVNTRAKLSTVKGDPRKITQWLITTQGVLKGKTGFPAAFRRISEALGWKGPLTGTKSTVRAYARYRVQLQELVKAALGMKPPPPGKKGGGRKRAPIVEVVDETDTKAGAGEKESPPSASFEQLLTVDDVRNRVDKLLSRRRTGTEHTVPLLETLRSLAPIGKRTISGERQEALEVLAEEAIADNTTARLIDMTREGLLTDTEIDYIFRYLGEMSRGLQGVRPQEIQMREGRLVLPAREVKPRKQADVEKDPLETSWLSGLINRMRGVGKEKAPEAAEPATEVTTQTRYRPGAFTPSELKRGMERTKSPEELDYIVQRPMEPYEVEVEVPRRRRVEEPERTPEEAQEKRDIAAEARTARSTALDRAITEVAGPDRTLANQERILEDIRRRGLDKDKFVEVGGKEPEAPVTITLAQARKVANRLNKSIYPAPENVRPEVMEREQRAMAEELLTEIGKRVEYGTTAREISPALHEMEFVLPTRTTPPPKRTPLPAPRGVVPSQAARRFGPESATQPGQEASATFKNFVRDYVQRNLTDLMNTMRFSSKALAQRLKIAAKTATKSLEELTKRIAHTRDIIRSLKLRDTWRNTYSVAVVPIREMRYSETRNAPELEGKKDTGYYSTMLPGSTVVLNDLGRAHALKQTGKPVTSITLSPSYQINEYMKGQRWGNVVPGQGYYLQGRDLKLKYTLPDGPNHRGIFFNIDMIDHIRADKSALIRATSPGRVENFLKFLDVQGHAAATGHLAADYSSTIGANFVEGVPVTGLVVPGSSRKMSYTVGEGKSARKIEGDATQVMIMAPDIDTGYMRTHKVWVKGIFRGRSIKEHTPSPESPELMRPREVPSTEMQALLRWLKTLPTDALATLSAFINPPYYERGGAPRRDPWIGVRRYADDFQLAIRNTIRSRVDRQTGEGSAKRDVEGDIGLTGARAYAQETLARAAGKGEDMRAGDPVSESLRRHLESIDQFADAFEEAVSREISQRSDIALADAPKTQPAAKPGNVRAAQKDLIELLQDGVVRDPSVIDAVGKAVARLVETPYQRSDAVQKAYQRVVDSLGQLHPDTLAAIYENRGDIASIALSLPKRPKGLSADVSSALLADFQRLIETMYIYNETNRLNWEAAAEQADATKPAVPLKPGSMISLDAEMEKPAGERRIPELEDRPQEMSVSEAAGAGMLEVLEKAVARDAGGRLDYKVDKKPAYASVGTLQQWLENFLMFYKGEREGKIYAETKAGEATPIVDEGTLEVLKDGLALYYEYMRRESAPARKGFDIERAYAERAEELRPDIHRVVESLKKRLERVEDQAPEDRRADVRAHRMAISAMAAAASEVGKGLIPRRTTISTEYLSAALDAINPRPKPGDLRPATADDAFKARSREQRGPEHKTLVDVLEGGDRDAVLAQLENTSFFEDQINAWELRGEQATQAADLVRRLKEARQARISAVTKPLKVGKKERVPYAASAGGKEMFAGDYSPALRNEAVDFIMRAREFDWSPGGLPEKGVKVVRSNMLDVDQYLPRPPAPRGEIGLNELHKRADRAITLWMDKRFREARFAGKAVAEFEKGITKRAGEWRKQMENNIAATEKALRAAKDKPVETISQIVNEGRSRMGVILLDMHRHGVRISDLSGSVSVFISKYGGRPKRIDIDELGFMFEQESKLDVAQPLGLGPEGFQAPAPPRDKAFHPSVVRVATRDAVNNPVPKGTVVLRDATSEVLIPPTTIEKFREVFFEYKTPEAWAEQSAPIMDVFISPETLFVEYPVKKGTPLRLNPELDFLTDLAEATYPDGRTIRDVMESSRHEGGELADKAAVKGMEETSEVAEVEAITSGRQTESDIIRLEDDAAKAAEEPAIDPDVVDFMREEYGGGEE